MRPVWLILATLVDGTLAAARAIATNLVVDRDIDKLMRRTINHAFRGDGARSAAAAAPTAGVRMH